ncbi:MAG: hypothetical protein ACR2FI_10540 [Burkholderiales bacterium]
MSAITDILDRLSGVAILKERLAETSKNVDRSLMWLLNHEKRLIRGEEAGRSTVKAPAAKTQRRIPRK